MRPDALAQQVEADTRAGLVPCFVCATVGTTSSNAMDPIPQLAEICRQHKPVAARRCRHVRHRGALPGIRYLQNGVNSPTVTTSIPTSGCHQLRLQLLLGRRPQSAYPNAQYLPGISAQVKPRSQEQ